jgi:hypothetical protein
MQIRAPLVSVTRVDAGDDKHTRLTYYVGETVIMDLDILREYVPSTGPVDELTLVQLLVTPHEHMALLGDILSYSAAGKTSGPEWDGLMQRATSILIPPQVK